MAEELQTLSPGDIPPANLNNETASFAAAPLQTYLVDATAANVVATLPDAAQMAGRRLQVVLVATGSSHTVGFAASVSGQLVNGAVATDYTPWDTVGAGVTLLSDGANFWASASY